MATTNTTRFPAAYMPILSVLLPLLTDPSWSPPKYLPPRYLPKRNRLSGNTKKPLNIPSLKLMKTN